MLEHSKVILKDNDGDHSKKSYSFVHIILLLAQYKCFAHLCLLQQEPFSMILSAHLYLKKKKKKLGPHVILDTKNYCNCYD